MADGSSATIKRYQVTKQELHVLEAKKALKDEHYELAIKEINEGIAMSNGNKNLIKDKVDIVSLFQCLAYDGLQKNDIKDTLKYIKLILASWDYLWKNNTYSEIVMNTFLELFKYLNNGRLYTFSEEALELVQDAGIYLREADCRELKTQKNKYVVGYLEKMRFEVVSLELGMQLLERQELHLRTINSIEVKKYKLVLYNRFNKYENILEILKEDLQELLNDLEGKRLLDLSTTSIKNCTDENIVSEYYTIFSQSKLPKYLVIEGIDGNFNFSDLSGNFQDAINESRFEDSDEIFECIYKYFDYKELDKGCFLQYLLKKKIYTLGIEYFDNLIKKSPKNLKIIEEKANFAKEIKGIEKGSRVFADEIMKLQELKDPALVCEALERYRAYLLDIRKLSDYDKIVLKLKYSKVFLKSIFSNYKRGIFPTKEKSLKVLISAINVNEDDLDQLIDCYNYYFILNITDYKKILDAFYDNENYIEGLKTLERLNIEDNPKEVLKLRLRYSIALNQIDEVEEICQKLLDRSDFKEVGSILLVYLENLMKKQEYSKVIEKCEYYLELKENELSQEELVKIYKILGIAAKRVRDGKLVFFYKLNRYIANDKLVKVIGILLIVICTSLIGQFALFKFGFIEPINIEYNFEFPSDKLDIGESREIFLNYNIKPFYSQDLELIVKSSDTNILKIQGNNIIGVGNGIAKLSVYSKGKEVYSKDIIVEKVKLIDFDFTKATHEKEITKVNDTLQLMFDLNVKDNRKLNLKPEIVSSNNNIIQVGNKGMLKAVGLGECEITVTIEGISKVLYYNVVENIEFADTYVFPNSDKRLLEKWEIEILGKSAIDIAEKEIYARNGYIFQDDFYNNYFNSMPWYQGKTSELNRLELNDFEIKNLELLGKIRGN